MRKFYFLLSFCLFYVFLSANAQETVVYNGENVAPDWWPVGSASEVGNHWDNPVMDAVNSTDKVATIWRNPGDDAWTGGGLGGLNLASQDVERFTLMVLKEAEGNVQLEIQDGSGNKEFLQALYSGASAGSWVELEFVISETTALTGDITTILVAPHIDDTKEDPDFTGHRMYWDELVAYSSLATGIVEKPTLKRLAYSQIFSITGTLVISRIQASDNVYDVLKPGVYIKVKHYSDGSTESEKIVVNSRH
ncbi:T9SS type A sorting domain-containing protein [Marinilabilia rubra]|uniref:Uncharacterized protein n=1 Tax=Marinilabilia rubra TaxID=2162893 RepID=A0A2U2B9R5_9BACT|nr:T9SS type A sorting domain-containing protein [Marinilabilia rubra]PWD99815.1 hypothetical protein DDZ16_07930 [Marinilabilia rubra]